MNRDKIIEILENTYRPPGYDVAGIYLWRNRVADEILASQWISVEDGLPEPIANTYPSNNVLVITKRGVQYVAYHCSFGWEHYPGCDDLPNVTHWQPLPAPPETHES